MGRNTLQNEWAPLKKQMQDIINQLELGITFYSLNKETYKIRKNPERFMICFCDSEQKKSVCMDKLISLGYACIEFTNFKSYNPDIQEWETWFRFKVDLQSLKDKSAPNLKSPISG